MALVTKSICPSTGFKIEIPINEFSLGKPRYLDKKFNSSEVKSYAILYAVSNNKFRYGGLISKRVNNGWEDIGEIFNISKDDFSADFLESFKGTRTRINFLGHKI